MRHNMKLSSLLLLAHASSSIAMNPSDDGSYLVDPQLTSRQVLRKQGSSTLQKNAKGSLNAFKTETDVQDTVKKMTRARRNLDVAKAKYTKLVEAGQGLVEDRASLERTIAMHERDLEPLLKKPLAGRLEREERDLKNIQSLRATLGDERKELKILNKLVTKNAVAREALQVEVHRLKLRAEHPVWWDEGVKYRGRKISATVLSGILAVGFILWAVNSQVGWFKFGSDTAPTPEVIHKPPPAVMMKEWCEDLHAAASQYEGSAQGDLAPETWNMHLDSLRPAWTVAYAEATRLGIQNMTQPLPVVGWNMPAPLLNQTLTPGAVVHASIADQTKIAEQRQQDSDTQDLIAVIRPIYLRHEFTRSFADEIHEIAFRMMKNSTGLPYPTESHYFDKAYAAMFWRMDISSDCAGYINEGKRITAQYKTARALQVVRHSDLKVAVDLHLDAKSALPHVAPGTVT